MRRLPWHVAVRADRKAVLTALGVALGIAFSLVSLAVPQGLETETVAQDGPYANQDLIVSRPGLAPFRLSAVDDASGVLLAAATLADGRAITLAAMEGPLAPDVAADEARPGPGLALPKAGASIIEPAARTWTVGAPVTNEHAGLDWLVVAPETLRALAPALADGHVTYAIVPAESAHRAAALRDAGFVVSPVPGVEPFFRDSTLEVARDLALVVAFSSVLVALFAYEFLSSEVREKRREIGLWRAVGMRANDVLVLLLARAGAITLGGMLVGFGLAMLALQVATRVTGSAIFAFHLSPVVAASVVAAFLFAGLLGGLLPAWGASRGLIRDQLEAPA